MADVVVITGGGSGMGLAAAKCLPSEKIVVLSGRTLSRLNNAVKVLEEAGITYPVLRASEEFAGFQTGYVPTTVFLTGEGKLMSQYPVIGSQSYDSWSSAVKGLLEVIGNE